jgi:Rps23 Pro-64 3,4-dihydroxylase Tpa1-like proline 4-hydroxylase
MLINKKFNLVEQGGLIPQLPFPHLYINDFFVDSSICEKAKIEFINFNKWDGEKNFYGSIRKKFCSNYENFPKYTRTIIDFLNSDFMLKKLEELTGIKNLISDKFFLGGGMHQTSTGGFLKVHADFNFHEKLVAYRRINLLLYLNKDWKKEYLGYLDFYDAKDLSKPQISIPPIFNSLCIFATTDRSYHGYPDPINCPAVMTRDSIALYYYTKEPFKNFGSRGKNLNTKYVSVNKSENLEFETKKNYIMDIILHPKTFIIKIYKFIFKNYRS